METNTGHNGIRDIYYAEEMIYPEEWSFCSHAHACYQIFCVLSGSLELYVNDTRYVCPAHSALIVPPHASHEMKRQEQSGQKVLEIIFDLDSDLHEVPLREAGVLVSLDELSLTCLRKVAVFAGSRDASLRSRAYSYLSTALVQLYTTEEDLHPHTLNAQFIDMTGFSEVTKEIIYYIETHFKSQFTLDDMGEALGYHKSYLCMKFKQDTQSTINDYLNLVRIFRFTEYYTFLDEEIAFICKHCGFTSASHFNKTYKKFLGMAPRNYARMRGPHFNSAVFESDLREHTENIQPLQSILARMDGPSRMDIQKVSPKEEPQDQCSKN